MQILFSEGAHLLSIWHGEKRSDLLGWVQEEKMGSFQMSVELSRLALTQAPPGNINSGSFRAQGPQG